MIETLIVIMRPLGTYSTLSVSVLADAEPLAGGDVDDEAVDEDEADLSELLLDSSRSRLVVDKWR